MKYQLYYILTIWIFFYTCHHKKYALHTIRYKFNCDLGIHGFPPEFVKKHLKIRHGI